MRSLQRTKESEREERPRSTRFAVTRWLTAPRAPPFDRYGIPRGPIKVSRKYYKWKIAHVFDFTWPAVFWFIGKQFSGKSTGVEDVEIEYIEHGGTAIDLCSADDQEGAGMAKAGYKTLFLCGNKVRLQFSKKQYDWMHVGDLKTATPDEVKASLLKLAEYQAVITVPGFYYSAHEMFRCVSYLIDLLKQRGMVRWTWGDKRHIFCVAIREAKMLLASRYYAGKVSSRQDAEMDLIDLVGKAFHTGIALCLDALRYMSITPEVRDITHYQFIKKLGRMKLPPEFNVIMRSVNPRYMRRMPKSKFILYTDEDDVYAGANRTVPWHVERGVPVLEELGIDVVPEEGVEEKPLEGTPKSAGGEAEEESTNVTEVTGKKWKVAVEIHKRIWALVDGQGLSYERAKQLLATGEDVPKERGGPLPMKLSVATVFKEAKAHREGVCICPEDQKLRPIEKGDPITA